MASNKKFYPSVGRCVYCGVSPDEAGPDGLSDEHIVPFSLSGEWILPNASCPACAYETHAFEGKLVGRMFEPPRAHFGWKSRKRKRRPDTLVLNRENKGAEVRIPVHQHPPGVFQPIFRSSPHLLTGHSLITGYGPSEHVPVSLHFTPGPQWKERFTEATEAGKPGFQMTLQIGVFFRTIAKIAHCYAIAEFGLEGADYLLRDIILGRKNDYPNYIGSLREGQLSQTLSLHSLGYAWINDYLVVRVRLYSRIGTPSQFVVAGRRLA